MKGRRASSLAGIDSSLLLPDRRQSRPATEKYPSQPALERQNVPLAFFASKNLSDNLV